MSNSIKSHDVCIIGGSIAGNYLAYLLAPLELTICVIEEHSDIGKPFQCAGIISQKLGDLIALPDNIILNRVDVAKIVAPSGKFIRLSGQEKPYIVDRVALDRLFYEKIKQKSNITYYLGEKYHEFEYITNNGEKVIQITTSKRRIHCKLLVGCDGPLSAVAHQLGADHTNIYATQIRAKGNFENEAVMYFHPNWKELFGWIVPEGRQVFRIGMGAANNLSQNFKNFLDKLKIKNNQIIDRQGGLIPFGSMKKVAYDNILLLGDAACQVKATTGGGIVMLLTAAKYAAVSVKRSFYAQNYSESFLKENYEIPCKNEINRSLKTHLVIRKIFECFTSEDFETFFQIVKTSNVENIISLYGDMDFPLSLFLQLLKNSMVFKFLLSFLRKNPLVIFTLLKILLK